MGASPTVNFFDKSIIAFLYYFNKRILNNYCIFLYILHYFCNFFTLILHKVPKFYYLFSVLCFITIINRILIIACQYLHHSVINTKNHIVIFNNFKASGKCVRHSFLKMCILRLFYNHIYMDIFTILGVRYYYISFLLYHFYQVHRILVFLLFLKVLPHH